MSRKRIFFVLFVVFISLARSIFQQKKWVEPTLLDVVQKRIDETVKFSYCTVLYNYLTWWNVWRVKDYDELLRVHGEFVIQNIFWLSFAGGTFLVCFVTLVIQHIEHAGLVTLVFVTFPFYLVPFAYGFTFCLLAIERDVLTATGSIFEKALNPMLWRDYMKSNILHERDATCWEALYFTKKEPLGVTKK